MLLVHWLIDLVGPMPQQSLTPSRCKDLHGYRCCRWNPLFGRTRIFFCLVWGLVAKAILKQNYNSGQKSLGQYCNIHIFLSFLASLLKQGILFKIFVAVLPPPTLYKVKTRKKILDTRVQHCLWGEGRGWPCVN